ncbi:hypothetical protein GGQ73_001837 [Rhizobium skierniewicense]|uniref:Uncharacterized protein n=1 Tax=Rhizobium skierniewicense TaxID=984260 RepID=A0A7W6C9Y8_9HYPH|nr:hypothetical protein [Rhizobium skierniewicense]
MTTTQLALTIGSILFAQAVTFYLFWRTYRRK